MSIASKVEKLERRIGIVKEWDAPCQTCAGLWLTLKREYGSFAPIIHSPAVCAELHSNLEKAYGGTGDGDGLKAAA
jgi:hypothetical protein